MAPASYSLKDLQGRAGATEDELPERCQTLDRGNVKKMEGREGSWREGAGWLEIDF